MGQTTMANSVSIADTFAQLPQTFGVIFTKDGFPALFSDVSKLPIILLPIFAFSMSDTFDTIGTFIGTGRRTGIFSAEDEKAHENGSLGKTECWFILDCKENATLVVGHNAKTKEELEQMIHEGRWKEFIREIPIKPGDFIQLDPGTVHAIKGGTLLLETQQSSDITYRVYDYDRLSNGKPRQLHIVQSIDVITVPAKSADNSVVHIEKKDDAIQQLIQCPYYTVYRIDVEHRVETWQDKPFALMSVVEGEGTLNGTHLKKGDHLILPDGYGKVELQGRMQIIASTI